MILVTIDIVSIIYSTCIQCIQLWKWFWGLGGWVGVVESWGSGCPSLYCCLLLDGVGWGDCTLNVSLFIPNYFSSVAFWTKLSNVYISEPKKMWKLNFLFSNLFDESLHTQKSCKHETWKGKRTNTNQSNHGCNTLPGWIDHIISWDCLRLKKSFTSQIKLD